MREGARGTHLKQTDRVPQKTEERIDQFTLFEHLLDDCLLPIASGSGSEWASALQSDGGRQKERNLNASESRVVQRLENKWR